MLKFIQKNFKDLKDLNLKSKIPNDFANNSQVIHILIFFINLIVLKLKLNFFKRPYKIIMFYIFCNVSFHIRLNICIPIFS